MGKLGEGAEDKQEQGVLHYLGVAETHHENGENPRILKVLTSMLERAIYRNDKELAIARNTTKLESNFNRDHNNFVQNDARKRLSDNSNYDKGDEENGKSSKQKLSVFNGMRAPSIGIESYIVRIHKYARCSPCCFVLAYAYLSKLISSISLDNSWISTQLVVSNPLLSSLNIHRLLITSIMLAAKFMDDSHYNNAYFAKIGGVSTTEINGLEMAFLKMVGYRLYVSPVYFERLCSHFVKESTMQATLLPLPHLPFPTLHCSFDEKQDKKVALVCIQCSGV